MNRIILFGAPGCGKGTQGDLVEEKFGFKKISTGDLVRAEIKSGSEMGTKIKAITEKGGLVSDDIIIGMVEKRVQQDDIADGYILDGFPRTLDQAKALSKISTDREIAIFLNVNEDAVVERLVSRLTCQKCGAIFNTKNKPPKTHGVCDACGGTLERRKDDNEATIRSRMAVYREQTEPVIAYYREQGSLSEVDADRPVEAIFADIQGILE